MFAIYFDNFTAVLRPVYTVQLQFVACNALTTRIVQCKQTLQLATTVRYNTKKVEKLTAIVCDNCVRETNVVQCKPVFSKSNVNLQHLVDCICFGIAPKVCNF